MAPPLHVYTPLPPSRNGIADYAYEQLPYLARDWEVTVVIDDAAPDPLPLPPGVRWRRRRQMNGAAVPRLYHCGNNPQHAYIVEEMRRCPGVTVLHDFVLHHLLVEMTLARDDVHAYLEVMTTDHGAAGLSVARHRARYLYSEFHQNLIPLNGSVLNHSRGLIVHSQSSLQRVGGAVPKVACIPHHYAPPPNPLSAAQARQALGIADDVLVISTLGFIREQKQTDFVLDALARIRHQLPPFQYWLVGEPPRGSWLAEKVAAVGLEGLVHCTGFVETEDFYTHLAATDLLINLRYPSAGETSGTLVRGLGMGVCAIVFDYGPYADYPNSILMRIPLDTEDPRWLCQAVLEAAASQSLRQRMGEAAHRYIAENHDLRRTASMYTAFLKRVQEDGSVRPATEATAPLSIPVAEFVQPLRDEEDEEDQAGCWGGIMSLLPRPRSGTRALVLGSHPTPLMVLRHYFGVGFVVGSDYDPGHGSGYTIRPLSFQGATDQYDVFLFNPQSDIYPFRDESFDLVVAGDLRAPPRCSLAEIGRVLSPGGMVLVALPHVSGLYGLRRMLDGTAVGYPTRPPAAAGWDAQRLRDYVQAAGFRLDHLSLARRPGKPDQDLEALLDGFDYPSDLRGEFLVAIACKH